jgi:hypothetical protein
MNNFKNILIATLTGLLALSLFTQPAQSAPASTSAKSIEYDWCFRYLIEGLDKTWTEAKLDCKSIRP